MSLKDKITQELKEAMKKRRYKVRSLKPSAQSAHLSRI
jgi:uncharacterized protein YqeY